MDPEKPISDQPVRPRSSGARRYDVLREAERASRPAKARAEQLFTMTLTATTQQGDSMENDKESSQFLIDLIFKPNAQGVRLRPEETQLLLAHIGEILKEVEDELNSGPGAKT